MIARIWMKGMTYPGHTQLLLLQRDVSVNTCFQLPVEPTFGRCPYFILQTFEECTAAANSLSQIPTPPFIFLTWDIAFSWSHEVRSKKHQADVTTKTRYRHVWLAGPSRHGRVLAAVLRQVAVRSGSAKLLEVRFFGMAVTVESLHHGWDFLWRSMVEMNETWRHLHQIHQSNPWIFYQTHG